MTTKEPRKVINLSPDLLDKMKIQAIREKKTLRKLVEEIFTKYLANK